MKPREYVKGLGWPVYAGDRQHEDKCKSCGATIYWVEILTRKGEVKTIPLSAALAKKQGEHTFMGGHHADCPDAKKYGGRR